MSFITANDRKEGEIVISDKPLLARGQYVGSVDQYKFYYNPMGYGGVTVVDDQSQSLIGLCDGCRTIEDLSVLDGRPLNIVMQEIKDLVEQEVLQISAKFTEELHRVRRKKSTIACWLHITNNCNLACSYCYIHKNPGNMSLETGKLTIDKMVESCLKYDLEGIDIKFAGGEPLLRFNFIKELVHYSQQFKNQVKVSYTLITNGTLVTQQIAEYLKFYNFGIGVSLDGVGDANDINRFDKNGQGSFSRVLKGLQFLKSANNRVGIMTTVSKLNHNGLLALTKHLLENDFGFRFSLQKDCETGWPELLNHTTELINSLNQCYDYLEANLPISNFFALHKFGDVSFMKPLKRCCSAGEVFFAVGHDGKIGACGLGLARPFATLEKNTNLLDIVQDNCSDLKNSIASYYPICSKCIWKTSCAGGCPLQTKSTYGVYDTISPYCEVYKAILPRILRIKAMQMIRNHRKN